MRQSLYNKLQRVIGPVCPDHASWEMRWPSANSRSAGPIARPSGQGLFIAGREFLIQLLARPDAGATFPPSLQEFSTAAPSSVRATKSVTCFGSRRGAAVLGEQNAPVAMAVNMH